MNSDSDSKPFITIEKDWSGEAGPGPAFRVEMRDDTWFFHVRVNKPPLGNPGAAPGKFHEGLWRYDVAEWFVANRDTGRYMEWNLAPNGAWWAMLFSEPRRRAGVLPDLQGVITESAITHDGWEAVLHVPRALLESALGAGVLTHNACFILGVPRQHFSWVNFPVEEPDFHLPKYFRALKSGS